jgi:ATP-binding protein involved in chromosome partitioning
MVTQTDVESAIRGYVEPYLELDLITTKSISRIYINNNQIEINIELGFPSAGYQNVLVNTLRDRLRESLGVNDILISVDSKIVCHGVQRGLKPLQGVKNIIAIASGKGGVGKSTTAVNLALGLSLEGAQVGLLDADIYGPSQPRMLGVKKRPTSSDGKSFEPIISYGIQSMSIGYLIEEEIPMIWRGPMVTQALGQLLHDTRWQDLDYLIIDLPPGTGDTHLTLAQKVPVSGAIIVTTPQDISLLDARKGLKMFEKVEVPILGIVENMSVHICPQCGYEEHIFGVGGGERIAAENNSVFLGALPLDKSIMEKTDNGHPTVISEPDGLIARLYRDIALRAVARLALQAKDYSRKFPKITVQNT